MSLRQDVIDYYPTDHRRLQVQPAIAVPPTIFTWPKNPLNIGRKYPRKPIDNWGQMP